MIRDRVIVCLASRWDYDPTSKHQVMRILARENDVVWVNHRASRRPRATAADAGAVASTVGQILRGVRRVGPRMVQFTPLVIPGARHPVTRAWNRRLLVLQVRRAMRHVRRSADQPVQVWTFAPDGEFLADALRPERFLYYCVDEYTEFENLDRDAVAAAEQRVLARADVVVTTSQALYESKRSSNANTHLVRHGVDAAHFAPALDGGLPLPTELAGIRGPMLGFFGLIHHWIDCDLLEAVAQLRPAYSLVLIGEDRQNHAGLRRCPNVHFLGRRPYGSLPAYCRAFSAGLLPFARTRMTRNVNPIKLREYLAAGLPVVSTPLPEAERYWPEVRIAADAESFAQACDEAVADAAPARRHARSRLVADETWDAVVERLSMLADKAPTVPSPAGAVPAVVS